MSDANDARDLPRTPPKTFAGVEYDFRKPTAKRLKSRAWNSEEPRLFVPRSFGFGYGVNLYRLFHRGAS